ncbi:MAG: peptidoglycan-binding protein [Polyangiaceae bacterium]
MPFPYTVLPGDHLARIAARFGFFDERTIWDDPANAELRKLRPNPEVLLPGDVVTIPDKQPRNEEGQTDRRHTFIVRRNKLRLRIAVRDRFHVPQANLPVELELEGDSSSPVTDGQAIVERPISPTTESGHLSALGDEVAVRVGFLDPVESRSGWKARLDNLGYAAGPVDASTPIEERSALEELQCDFGLPVTGAPDAATLQKLLEVHGS